MDAARRSSAPRVRPFPFDRLDRVAQAQVDAGRVLLSHLPLASPSVMAAIAARLGGPVRIALVEAYAFPVRELMARLPGPPAPVLIRLAAPLGRFGLLAVDAGLAVRAARQLLGESAPPRDLHAAGLGLDEQRALADLLDPLFAPVPARVDGFLFDDGEIVPLFPDPFVLALDARVHTPFGDGYARLLAPDRLRLRPPLPHSRATHLAHRARLDGARVALPMEIGRTRLPRAELAGLVVGDVILFDEFGPRPPFGGPLVLRLGHGAIRVWLDGEGLTVVKSFELGAARMEPPKIDESLESPESPDPADSPFQAGSAGREDRATDALLGELPVEVVCELGRVTISGRELLELRPGAVIPVGRPLAGPVDLTVGGRVVARGELVDVEGEIGVRLTQVSD